MINAALEFLRGPDITRFGWTLVHFLWQGAVLAAAFTAVRTTLRKTSTNARYLAGCLTLLLMAACVVGTFVALGPAERPNLPLPAATTTTAPPTTNARQAEAVAPVTALSPAFGDRAAGAWQAVEAGLPWVVGLWAVGVGLFSLRLAGGWLKVRQTRRGSSLPPDDPLCERFRELRQRLRVSRHVRLIKSALVRVPMVVGWFRPLILLPASTLSGLSPVQLDLILAHELAHLRRWDHWVNLGQLLLETVLFYHPAVWWVSRCVREDREHCCDELAVAACGNRLALARALTALEELRQVNAAFALAATDGSLLARVRRILALPDDERGGVDRRAAGSALLALGLLMFATGAVQYATSPRFYTAVARLQSASDVFGLVGAGTGDEASKPGSAWLSPRGFGGNGEVMRPSDIVLTRLLNARKSQADPQRTNELSSADHVESLEHLRRRVRLRRVSFPLSVQIEVDSESTEGAREAVSLANRIGGEYIERFKINRTAGMMSTLQVLRVQATQMERDVTDLEAALQDAADQWDIPEAILSDGRVGITSPAHEQLDALNESLRQARNDLAAYEIKLKILESLRAEDWTHLRDATLTVLPAEQLLPLRLDDLDKAEQNVAKLMNRFAPDHPELNEALALQTVIQTQVSNRVEGLLEGLRANVGVLQARQDALSNQVKTAKLEAEEEAGHLRAYAVLKRKADAARGLFDMILSRLSEAEVMQRDTPAGVAIDPAVTAVGPWRRTYPYDLWLMGGGLFMTLSGLVVRNRPKPANQPGSPAKP